MKKIFVLTELLILAFSLLMSLLFQVSFVNGMIFWLFTTVELLFQGFLILRIFNIKVKTDIELITYSIFLGYLAVFVEYFLIVPFGMQDNAVLILGIVLILLLAICFYRSKRQKNEAVKQESDLCIGICLGFIIIILFIEIFVYAGKNLLPSAIDYNLLHNDTLYWIGNTIELTKEFPPKDFRDYPSNYNYHYFSSIPLAVVSIVTKISPAIIGFAFQFVYPVMMMVYASFCLFRRITKDGKRLILAMFCLFFTAGFQDFTIVTYTHHIMIGPFGFDYGLALFLFFSLLTKEIYDCKECNLKIIVLMELFFALMCGTKASFAAISLVGLGMMCLYDMYKKQRIRALVIGLLSLFIFGIIYFYVTNISGYAESIEAEFKQPQIWERNAITANCYNYLSNKFGFLGVALFFGLYIILCNPFLVIGIVYTLSILIKQKNFDYKAFTMCIMMLVSCLITLFVPMIGASQMYFLMAIWPIGIIFLLNYHKERINRIKYIVATILLLTSVLGWIKAGGAEHIPRMVKRGLYNYLGIETVCEPTNKRYISDNTMEAYEWVKENAQIDDRIIVNNDIMIPGVMSECYISTSTIGEEIFNTLHIDEEAYYEMKKDDITWIVYIDKDNRTINCETNYVQLLFENQEVQVYQLL